MIKSNLRHIYKERRQQLTNSQLTILDDLLLIQFQKLPIDIPVFIMTYEPIAKWNEFDPQTITDYCYFKNPEQQLFYPIITDVEAISTMVPVLVNDATTFELSAFGFSQPVDGMEVSPEDIDLVIVPLLAFDEKGYRVGYGKGYYDKFLKNCRSDVIKVGFSYFEPVDTIEDINGYDVPLDFCITHEKIYIF
jgi:5-formyltetrahydrofolate cyclo-ligase